MSINLLALQYGLLIINMELYRLHSNYKVDVKITKYLINWYKSPSKEQQILQDFLFPFWKNKIVLAEFKIPGSKLRTDILNITDKIHIEYSPDSTHDFSEYFHKHRLIFIRRNKNDINKMEWAIKNGFKSIEIGQSDLKQLSRRFFWDNFNILL